ncbi:MAG TPA: hypothetical protein VL484_04395 [Vicinamibacterales bacterium]|jgi:hypothetical protein|nr:hypothetical protein [Vicinamibacterales bacterium]
MLTKDTSQALAHLFAELTLGTSPQAGYVLNRGDVGLLRSLERLSAADASKRVDGGATIAAHALHLQYGLSLFNRWADQGGNPFSDAKWDEAWKTAGVDDAAWGAIRDGLHEECTRWLEALKTPREVDEIALTGLMASVAHLAYHLGAIRQIDKSTRGPREGTF